MKKQENRPIIMVDVQEEFDKLFLDIKHIRSLAKKDTSQKMLV